MTIFYEAFEREKNSDIKHYGVRGMRWGVINKADLKGGKAGGIARGIQRSSDARSLETWTLKDKVERMKLESDYRKLSEEEETYAATQAQKLRTAKIENVMTAVQTIGAIVGTVGGVIGLVNAFGGNTRGIGEKFKAMNQKRKQTKYGNTANMKALGNRPVAGGKSK